MNLVNTSETKTVYLKTKKGTVKIGPKQVIQIELKDILTAIPSSLRTVPKSEKIETNETQKQNVEENKEDKNKEDNLEVEDKLEVDKDPSKEVPLTKQQIQEKIELLKVKWEDSTKPRTKERIQKQILKLEEKLK